MDVRKLMERENYEADSFCFLSLPQQQDDLMAAITPSDNTKYQELKESLAHC